MVVWGRARVPLDVLMFHDDMFKKAINNYIQQTIHRDSIRICNPAFIEARGRVRIVIGCARAERANEAPRTSGITTESRYRKLREGGLLLSSA